MKKALLLAAILAAIDLITPAIDTGAQVAVFPAALILGIVSAITAQKQAADQKQAQQQAASANAAKGGGQDAGMSMKPVFTAADKSTEAAAREATGQGDMAFKTGATPDWQNIFGGPQAMRDPESPTSGAGPGETRINQALAQANATGKPADPTGQTKATATPELDMETIEVGPQQPEKQGMFGDMSTADKVAMAATLGSMLRGSDRQMPAPGRGGAGGPGINMQPVFQNTIRDLYR